MFNNFNDILNELICEEAYMLPKAKRKGNKINCQCFICGDGKKNSTRGWFYTDNDPVSYYCWNEHCSAKGINLFAALLGVDTKDAYALVMKEVAKRKRNQQQLEDDGDKSESVDVNEMLCIDVEEDSQHVVNEVVTPPTQETSLELPHYFMPYEDSELATKVVKGRKLLSAPFVPKNWKLYYSTMHKRIAIPWVNNGITNGFQYRAISKKQDPKYLFQADSKKSVFVGQIDNDFPYIFMMEGVFDAIFVRNGVAIGGIKPNPEQLAWLQDRYPFHKLVYFFDNPQHDTSSVREIKNLAKYNKNALVFCWERCGYKDVNEAVLRSKVLATMFADADYLAKNTVGAVLAKVKLLFNK